MTLAEPDVALTDFALAIECALLALWLPRDASAHRPLRAWFVIFFSAVGVGALLGGITHGLIADQASIAARAMWTATLLAIGVAALACWSIGAHLVFSAVAAKRIVVLAALLFALYAAAVLVRPWFAVAVAHYAPAGAFLLAAFVLCYFRRRAAHLLSGIAGVVLSFAAAAVQQTEAGLPALNLSHNAVYHVLQGIALALIFLTARGLTRGTACRHGANS